MSGGGQSIAIGSDPLMIVAPAIVGSSCQGPPILLSETRFDRRQVRRAHRTAILAGRPETRRRSAGWARRAVAGRRDGRSRRRSGSASPLVTSLETKVEAVLGTSPSSAAAALTEIPGRRPTSHSSSDCDSVSRADSNPRPADRRSCRRNLPTTPNTSETRSIRVFTVPIIALFTSYICVGAMYEL